MSNQIEVNVRIDTLLALKAQGHSYSKLVQVACQHWQVSERQAKRYLSMVEKQEAALASGNSESMIGNFLSRYRYLFVQALQNKDYHLAGKLLTDEVKATERLQYKRVGVSSHASLPPGSTNPSSELAVLFDLLAKEKPTD
jgi:hypothetical protein